MASKIVSQKCEDGIVHEVLDDVILKDGDKVNILWPDQYKENHQVMVISEIVPNGTREKAHIRVSLHGVYAPVSLTYLVSLGVEVSRKSLW